MSPFVESREDVIRTLAYQKWEQAGSPQGDGVDFWLDAEAEFDSTFDEALDDTLATAVGSCPFTRVAAK